MTLRCLSLLLLSFAGCTETVEQVHSDYDSRTGIATLRGIASAGFMDTEKNSRSFRVICVFFSGTEELCRAEGYFRADIESFVSREVVDSCIVPGRHELPPVHDGAHHYVGFVDPSGGSADSMTMAVAHQDRNSKMLVLDCVRERRPPFSPDDVTHEFAEVLKTYRVTTVRGDRYGGEWPRERFRKNGINYLSADKAKSDLYRELLPALNAGNIELLDNSKLVAQLGSLERRTARGGRDSIDHPPGAGSHDDLENVVAGVLLLAGRPVRMPKITIIGDDDTVPVKGHWLSGSGQYFRGIGT